jgi:hypothetical protein
LSSRKLWVGAAIFAIGMVLCLAGDTENGMTLIAIGGGGYLGAEAIVDVVRAIFGVIMVYEDEDTETEDGADNE